MTNDNYDPLAPIEIDTLAPVEIPVTIEGKKYKLREASESAATDYRNAQLMSMTVNENNDGNRIARVGKVIDTESILVASCLFQIIQTDTNIIEKSVPVQEVRKWPHRVVSTLFKRAEMISALQKDETKEDLVKQKKAIETKLAKLESQEVPEGEDKAISLQELNAKN